MWPKIYASFFKINPLLNQMLSSAGISNKVRLIPS